MDTRFLHLFLTFSLFLSFSCFLNHLVGEEATSVKKLNEQSINVEKSNITIKKDNYYFNIFENGEIEAKQLISWKDLFGVLYYEVTVREKDTEAIIIDRLYSEKNTVEVSLKP
jgi:lipoprotein